MFTPYKTKSRTLATASLMLAGGLALAGGAASATAADASSGASGPAYACANVGTTDGRADTVDRLNNVAASSSLPRDIAGAEHALSCTWAKGDITSISMRIVGVTDENARVARDALATKGYECTETADGLPTCERVRTLTHAGHPYTITDRVLYDGRTWLQGSWSNIDGEPLFDSVATLFGH